MFNGSSIPAAQRTRWFEAFLALLGAICVVTFVFVPLAGLAAVIACAALWFISTSADVFRGKLDGVLLWWAALFPLGYYFLSFPREHSVVTFDRVAVLLAFIGLYFARPSTLVEVPLTLRRAGYAFLAFVAVASLTLVNSPGPLNPIRALADGFLLPLLLAVSIIARFDVRRRLPSMHTAVCISSVICAVVAVAEIILGQDLLPIGPPAAVYAGIIRPNGPFESNDTLALIGAVSFFLLLFLRAASGHDWTAGRRTLHVIGLLAALAMALLPMFRSVLLTLLLILVIDTFWEVTPRRRFWRVWLMFAAVGSILILTVVAPNVFEDRSSGQNVYARVAQFQQSIRVFEQHPIFGVGLLNFHSYVTGEPSFVASYEGVYSVDWPHDSLLAVLTETGIVGFVPYVASQVLLFMAMWRLRSLNRSGQFVWKYFVYIFLSYWITGLSESSGYGPLNLWSAFAIGVFCRYVLTEPERIDADEVQILDQDLAIPVHAS